MTKTARRSLIALAGFFLLMILLMVIAAMLVESRWARGLLEEQISQRVGGREVVIGELDVDWGWPLGIHLGDFSIANADWAEHEQMLELAALDVTVNVGELLTGSIGLERIDVQQPVIHLARREDGTANWDALMSEEANPEDVEQAEESLGIQPDIIMIDQGQLTYRDAGLDADVTVDFQTTGGESDAQRLQVQAQGQFQDRPLQLSAEGDAPSRALTEEDYAVNFDGNLGDIDLSFDGQAHNVLQLDVLQGRINVSVPEEADIASLVGQPALTVPALDFQAQLNHEGERWALEDIQTQAGEDRLTGMLAMVQGDTPRVDVQLHADQLDLNRWNVLELLETQGQQAAESASRETAEGQSAEDAESDTQNQNSTTTTDQESESSAEPAERDSNERNLEQRLAQRLAPLREYAGQVEITVGRLLYGEETLREVALQAQLDTGRLELQQLRAVHGDGEVSAQGEIEVQPESLASSLDTRISQLNLGQALAPLGFNELGVFDGETHTRFADGVLTLENSELAYRAAALDVQVQAESREIAETQAPGVHLQGSGTRNDQDFRFELTLGPLLDLNNPDQPFPVEGTLAAAGISGQLDGTITQPLDPSAVDISLHVQSDDLSTANPLVGLDLPEQTPFRLQGRLLKNPEEQRLALQDFEAQLGDNQVTGLLALVQGDTPRFDVQLHADRIDLNRWGVMELLDSDESQQGEPEEPAGENEPLQQRLARQLALLRRYQGQVDIAIDELLYGDEALRDMALQGQLDTGHLEIRQLRAVQGDGGLDAQGSLDVRSDTVAGSLDAQLDQVDLGQAMAPFGVAGLGVLDGQVHTRFAEGTLELHDTALAYRAPAQELNVQVQAETRQTEGDEAPGMHIEGGGDWRAEPFNFNLDLGPLLGLNDAESPYSVQGALSSRDTALYVDGTLTRPFAPESADAQVRVEGPSPAALNGLLDQELPELPAYQVSGRLRWQGSELRMTDVEAELGDSDLNGDIRFQWSGRPTLWATLNSRQLNESDFEALWASEDEEEEGPLFSEEPLNLEPLRTLDVVVDYSADSLNARDIPLSDVQLEAELQQGVLTLDPVRIGVGGGELTAQLRADAQQAPLDGQLELSLSQVELTPLIQEAELPEATEGASDDSAGILGGKGELQFQGHSVADIMASLDGTVEMAVSRGYLDVVIVELLGLDVGEALVGALADSSDQVAMQCAYARLVADSGLTELEQFYVGTEDANFTAGGTIDLNTEALDLTFEAHPKDTSFLSANTPVSLEGTLSDMQVSVVSTSLVARGVASVLGAIVAPPLAILPWVEAGTGEGVGPGCRQALEEYETPSEQSGQ